MVDIEYPQRVAPLAAGERTARQAELVGRTGSELAVFTTLVRSPDVFADFLPFGTRLLNRSTLDPRERELLILRAAHRCRAPYVWSHHVSIGRAAGVTDADLADVAGDGDHLLLRAADELVADHRLGDATWRELTGRYPTEQIIEICMLVGAYAMLAGTLNSLGVQLED